MSDFTIGDIVYLVTDIDQHQRMVTGIDIRPGTTLYWLACGDSESTHYAIEISAERDESKAMGL